MEYNKDYIITEYIKLKAHLGKSPSSAVFAKETGIHKRHLEKVFGSNSFSKLVSECGDTPNEFFKPKSDLEEIITQWGNLARKLGKLPTAADWSFNNCTPSADGITRSHNLKWKDFPFKFLEFHSGNTKWSDIIALIPSQPANAFSDSHPVSRIEGLTLENLRFIPPVVQNLIDLSVNEKKSGEFEKSVNLVFEMLGFEVTEYGQGTGRNPDGIAKENQFRYAILIDAKTRKNGYKFGTEDRKFIEYIKTFSEPLRKSGYSKIYFLIVSSRFDSISQISIKNISLETQVTTSLLTSGLLLKLLANKIKSPRLFDLKVFQELLIDNGEITERKIDKFISGRK